MPNRRKVLITGAAGYIAGRMLPEFRERYELVLLDVKTTNRQGEAVEGVQIAELTDPIATHTAIILKALMQSSTALLRAAVLRTSSPTSRWHTTFIRPV